MVRLRTLVWLALRNLGRELRRSALTAAAMAIGLALLILSRTLADGAHEDWIDAGVRLGAGHVSINAPGYRDSRSLDDRLSPAQLRASLAAIADAPTPDPPLASVRVTTRGLASSPEGALPALIVGVDPEVELAFSKLGEEVVDGRYLEEGDRLHAYIGAGMAERLGVRTGIPHGADGAGRVGRHRGAIGARRRDLPTRAWRRWTSRFVHIPLGTARSWLGVEGATTVAVLLPHSSFTDAVVEGVRGGVDPAAHRGGGMARDPSGPVLGAEARRRGRLGLPHDPLRDRGAGHPQRGLHVGAAPAARDGPAPRSRAERTGNRAGRPYVEGILLTMASGIAGVALGLVVVWIFFRDGLDLSGLWPEDFNVGGVAFDPVLYPVIEVKHVVQSVIMTAAIGLFASAYPAWQAGRLDPAESVKVE